MVNATQNAKICTSCGETYPATQFYFNRQKRGLHGIASWCRKCNAAKMMAKRGKFDQKLVDSFWERAHLTERQNEAISNGNKICSRCGEKKSLCEYHDRHNGKGGKVELCKECESKMYKPYYEANKENIKARVMKVYLTNHEEGKEKQRKRYRNNKEKFNDYHKKYVENNREKVASYKKCHYQLNRDLYSSWSASRRERERRGRGFTEEEISEMYDRQNGLCKYCGSDLSPGFHRDHIMPLFLSGINQIENIQLLCPSCNWSKGAKHPDEFEKQLRRGA